MRGLASGVLLMVCVSATAADPMLTKESKAARDYAFDSVSFKTSEAAIVRVKKKRGAIVSDKPVKPGSAIRSLHVESELEGRSYTVWLYEKQVAAIRVYYPDSDLKASGGLQKLIDRLERQFGEGQGVEKPGILAWDFPSVTRRVTLSEFGDGEAGGVVLMVEDTERMQKALRRSDTDK
jgi:hypothetical protein